MNTGEATPQTQPIPWSEQIKNSAGGYSWGLDAFRRLRRFLILGVEGGSYYASAQTLLIENATAVIECLNTDPARTIGEIVSVSDQGLALRNDPALFALALALSHPNLDTRKLAADAVPQVARIGTHLFHLYSYTQNFRGWSRGLRSAFARWYTNKTADDVAYQLVKYQSRDGVSHADLLFLTHVKPPTQAHDDAFGWATGRVKFEPTLKTFVRHTWDAEKKEWVPKEDAQNVPSIIGAFELAKTITDENLMAEFVTAHRLTREMIPSQFHVSLPVQRAMLPNLGIEALVRNLGNLTAIGLLSPQTLSIDVQTVIKKLTNEEQIRRSRLHPLRALIASKVYSAGRGQKGSNSWMPVPQIQDALNHLFYASFPNVLATGKRYYLGVDVSGSMGTWNIETLGNMTPRELAAAMMMVTYRTEPVCVLKGFSHRLVNIPLRPKDTLETVQRTMAHIPMGGTDCALPMLDAALSKIPVDVFVVYTDSETWFGKIHPAQALQQYRVAMQIPAKLMVVGMTANNFTIADPRDPDMMDVAGFSADFPEVLRTFALE